MKKKLFTFVVTAVMVTVGVVLTTVPVLAGTDIRSTGSLLWENGAINICTADIGNLQAEVDGLYQELPEISRSSYYGTARRNNLQSRGRIIYDQDKVVIDAADLLYLADSIDSLEAEYKTNAVSALCSIGTYFTAGGAVTHDGNGADSLANAPKLSFGKIQEGILKSQSVDHLAGQNIAASTADNLSKGSAAWVNGKLIIGNGADNDAYYRQGFADGQLSLYDKASISYVYHEHTGSSTSGGGCYTKAEEHSHSINSGCYEYREGHHHSIGNGCYADGDGWYHSYDCSNDNSGCPSHPYLICTEREGDSHYELVCTIPEGTLSGYSLGCGKTTDVIEAATIVFGD